MQEHEAHGSSQTEITTGGTHQLKALVGLIGNDAFAMSFQSVRQYREALLNAAPAVQGEPDVSALVEALTMARETIASALRANAPDYFTTDADIARHVVIQRIDNALAATASNRKVSHDNQ